MKLNSALPWPKTSQSSSHAAGVSPRTPVAAAVEELRVQTARAPAMLEAPVRSGVARPTQRAPAMVAQIAEQFRHLPAMAGLQVAYSPNHTLTTDQHLQKQLQMLAMVVAGDYESLAAQVKHQNENLRASAADIKNVVEPLVDGLTESDIKVFAVLAGIHDLGKVSRDWALQNHVDIAGIDFIAHDYETKILLQANPEMLSRFALTKEETDLVLELSKIHSFPGQFAFGEGNLAAYENLFALGGDRARRALKLARAQGVIDVMSALNETFVKPILASHVTLRESVDRCIEQTTSPVEEFARQARVFLNAETVAVAERNGMHPTAAYRLLKLIGLKDDQNGEGAKILTDALAVTDKTFISRFNRVTEGADTWYGTYIFNAFGGSMVAALGKTNPDTHAVRADAAAAVIKMTAVADVYRNRYAEFKDEGGFAFSALAPAQMVKHGDAEKVLKAIRELKDVDSALRAMADGSSPLTLRGNAYAVEIGFAGYPDSLNGVGGVARAIAGAEPDFRFYHIVNHLIDAGFNTNTRKTEVMNERYVNAFDATHVEGDFVHGNLTLKQIALGTKGAIYQGPDHASVYKAALRPADCAFNEIEAAVARDLTANHALYGVDVLPILEVGENGSYLKKPLVDVERFGGAALARSPAGLSRVQLQALEALFDGARLYAANTGISLDLTSGNLLWNTGQCRWQVIDAGPRTSQGRRKYTYTTGCDSFNDYLKIWAKDAKPSAQSAK